LLGKPEILDAPLSETSASNEPGSQAETVVPPELAEIPISEEAARSVQPESPAVAETERVVTESTESPAVAVSAAAEKTTDEPPVPGVINKVEVLFSDACWTDIRDASGDFRSVGNKAAGERFVLGGVPPYKMVFGNAAAVKITVSGESYDLAPYTRGNVARLTLDPR
jgi:cytoskeleton protein RodZ